MPHQQKRKAASASTGSATVISGSDQSSGSTDEWEDPEKRERARERGFAKTWKNSRNIKVPHVSI